jgi:predicted AlkP superfamily pyrophosphatase or phosphodiesterase
VNSQVTAQIAMDQAAMAVPAYCASHDRAIPVGGMTVGTGRFARKAGDVRAFRASPEFDGAVLALSTRLVDDMKLGRQAQTDILSIGLSATDYIGHSYGTEGLEMCLQMGALDRAIGVFLEHLDAQGIDYIVSLTADHGGHDLPERNRDHAFPAAQRVDAALAPNSVDAALRAKLKLDRRLIHAESAFGDFYIAKDLPKKQRAKVLKQAIAIYSTSPQVAAVFTHDFLAAQPAPSGSADSWNLAQKARASFNPERSGDFIVLGQPWVTPIIQPAAGAYVATHGSPWNYDRRVPILFWRKGMAPFEQPLAVETVDILPTLAAQIGLAVPKQEIDGRCLDLDASSNDSCTGTR